MNTQATKLGLKEPQARLIELLQHVNFGRIEHLIVRAGLPVFDPPPKVIQKLKMGGDNSPRPESSLTDFLLKQQAIDLLQTIAEICDGEVLSIDIKYGLPLAVEIEKDVQERGRSHA